MTKFGKTIFVNYVDGNDKNDGSSPEKAVLTDERIWELITPGGSADVTYITKERKEE